MPINYVPGSGVKDKAVYTLGKYSVPASVVTRLIGGLEGKTGRAFDRAFDIAMLKYSNFVEALDAAGISPSQAVDTFKTLRPVKIATGGERASKIEKLAEVLAPKICQRFKGDDPEALVRLFVDSIAKPEFLAEAVDVIKAHKANFGMNPVGHIKTSGRKANPHAMKALAEARKKKAKAKK